MYILGISAYYHDSAVALLKEGEVICAIEEERLSGIKHDNQFPFKAINYCLNEADININDVDHIVFYEKPLKKLERFLDSIVKNFPFSQRPFIELMPGYLSEKIQIQPTLRKKLGYRGNILYGNHHHSHASAAYYPSPFADATVVTIDGIGEYETTVVWNASGNTLKPILSLEYPHSLGLWYSTFTAYLGFRVNFDEYKVMAMAGCGNPKFAKQIRQTITSRADGTFELNQKYFDFQRQKQMWNTSLENLLGTARSPNSNIDEKHFDIAASVQQVFEEVYLATLNEIQKKTGQTNLCLGGGVALNAVANGKILSHTKFNNVYIFGASGDSGAALGAALGASRELNSEMKRVVINDLRLGALSTHDEIEKALEKFAHKLNFTKHSENSLLDTASTLLAEGNILGWHYGRSEFGPRALGARSILARPDKVKLTKRLNTIKHREEFRPFGGMILESFIDSYLHTNGATQFPFMNHCFKIQSDHCNELVAITHKDGTCRLQSVNEEHEPIFSLLHNFHQKTGIPCLLNTSFNVQGQPMVETPHQAIEAFRNSTIDVLVLGNFLVYRR